MAGRDIESKSIFAVLNRVNREKSVPCFSFVENPGRICIFPSRPEKINKLFCRVVLTRDRTNNKLIAFFSPQHAKCNTIEFVYDLSDWGTVAADVIDYYSTGLLPFRVE